MRLILMSAAIAAVAAPILAFAATDLAAVSACAEYHGSSTSGAALKFRVTGEASAEYQHDHKGGSRGNWTPWMQVALSKDREGNLVIGPTESATWYLKGDARSLNGSSAPRNGTVNTLKFACAKLRGA